MEIIYMKIMIFSMNVWYNSNLTISEFISRQLKHRKGSVVVMIYCF